jgi:hypothetical protein
LLTVDEGKPLWLGLLVGVLGLLIIAACTLALLYLGLLVGVLGLLIIAACTLALLYLVGAFQRSGSRAPGEQHCTAVLDHSTRPAAWPGGCPGRSR